MNEDFFNRTAGGGVITLISSLIMATLFLSELRECLAARFATTDATQCTTVQHITASLAQPMWPLLARSPPNMACCTCRPVLENADSS